jgi:hypothetical protein
VCVEKQQAPTHGGRDRSTSTGRQLTLPLEPFRYYQYGERVVHLDGCVEVEAAGEIVEGQVVHTWQDKSVLVVRVASGDLVYNVPISMLIDGKQRRRRALRRPTKGLFLRSKELAGTKHQPVLATLKHRPPLK